MSTTLFKVGDVVVVTKNYFSDNKGLRSPDMPIGTVSTIIQVEGDEEYPEYYLVDEPDSENYYTQNQLELESIYNAPLNKALR